MGIVCMKQGELHKEFNYAIIVDDKIRPREWGIKALEGAGFKKDKIVVSYYGDHAFDIYNNLISAGETVDLVLSDYHMNVKRKPPQGISAKFRDAVILSGIELAEAIFRVNPQQKFCLTSAGMSKDIVRLATESGIELILYKRRPEDKKFSSYTQVIQRYANDNLDVRTTTNPLVKHPVPVPCRRRVGGTQQVSEKIVISELIVT